MLPTFVDRFWDKVHIQVPKYIPAKTSRKLHIYIRAVGGADAGDID